MLQLAARIEAPAPERRELLQALLTWTSTARREPGVVVSHVYEDLEGPTAFYLVTMWVSREAMEAHLAGPKFGVILGALDVLAATPTVHITEVGEEDARDALAAIRRLRDRGGDPAKRGGVHETAGLPTS